MDLIYLLLDKLGLVHNHVMVRGDEAILCRPRQRWYFLSQGYRDYEQV
jgi:hypothetical protein